MADDGSSLQVLQWIRRCVDSASRSRKPPLRSDLGAGRIFGIGLSRTGTTSLNAALEVLSYPSRHFPADATTMRQLTAFMLEGGDSLRLSVLDSYAAITDTPACVAVEALDVGYPGSKFILTTREKGAWLDSCRRYWASFLEPFLADNADLPAAHYIRAISRTLYGSVSFEPVRYARAYDEYHDRIHTHFRERSSDLLVIDICAGDRWEPLCAFLGRPVPGSDFPRTRVKDTYRPAGATSRRRLTLGGRA